MSAHVAGAAYVELMNRDPADREYRQAFLDLALRLVPRGGHVFDFGSGPGIDARHYAEAGLSVDAYDSDPTMRGYFRAHCAQQIDAGSVTLQSGSYAQFLDAPRTGRRPVDLIVANFAPLNLIGQPAPLFRRFSTMLTSTGPILVSVLNPWFHALRESRRSWLRVSQLLWAGRYQTRLHGTTSVIRWRPQRLAREAAPSFELTATYVPTISTPDGRARLVGPWWNEWPRMASTQFLFLQFERSSR